MASDLSNWPPPTPLDAHSRPQFPASVLPEWLRRFVLELAEETQTPPDLPGILALPTLATACAKRAFVQVGPSWIEPLSLWVVAVLGSGNRKTAVLNRMVAPIVAYEKDWLERSRSAVAVAWSERRTLEGQLRHVEAQLAKSDGPVDRELVVRRDGLAERLAAMPVEVPPRLVVEDITPESLASTLAEQGGRIALLSDEGGPFDIMGGRYSKNGLPNLDVYLKGDSASDIRVDRRGRPSEFVAAPALTFGLAVQPDVIRGLAGRPGFRGKGLLARFLFSWPQEMVGRRKVGSVSVSPGADAAYCDHFRRLLAGVESVKEEPNRAPVAITLGANAKRLLDDFARELEPQLGEHGPLGHLQDWGSKATGKVARIAGLLHVAEAGSIEAAARSPIGVDTVNAATTIGRYLIEHAKIAFAEMGADPEQGQARLILGWLESRGLRRFTKRDAFNGLRSRFGRVTELDPPLRLLVDLGYLRPLPQEGEVGPGRPASPAFAVNPHVHSHKSQNPRNPDSADYAYSAT